MNEIKDIPEHWKEKKLRDVCKELQSGKRPKGGVQGIETGIPSLGAEHLNYNGGFKFEKIKFVPKEFAEQMKKGIVRKDDIIVVKDGATTGKTSFIGSDFPFEFAVINEHVFIVRLTEDILPKYGYYKLFSSIGHKEILEDFRGAAQGGISSGFLDKVNIAFPPLPEQQAIVSKIEELLSDLENGKQQLQTAQQQLKIYRQSLLKWAFEGRLTNKNVKVGELPKGWKVVELKNITDSIQYGYTKSSSKDAIGPKFLRITDIQENKVIWSEVPYCKIEKEIRNKYLLKEGDLVFARTGATVGKSFLIKGKIPEAVFASYLIRVRVNKEINEKYLSYYFQSPNYWGQITEGQVGIGQPNVNGTKLGQLKIPIASLSEQQTIISELEAKLTVCDKIEETISQTLQQTETLKQSILKKAFEGKLVKKVAV